jgi:hypothetical protein
MIIFAYLIALLATLFRSALTARQFKPVKVIGNAIGLILAIIYFACFWLILFTILS